MNYNEETFDELHILTTKELLRLAEDRSFLRGQEMPHLLFLIDELATRLDQVVQSDSEWDDEEEENEESIFKAGFQEE